VGARRTIGTALLALALVAGGCGGGATKADQTAQIKQNWARFFDGSTPAATKVQLLDQGQRFAALIQAQANSPLAKQTKATVTKVVVRDPEHATVTYTISIAGQPALKNQVGTAVRVGGVWKVSTQSFCALLKLQGGTPPPCRGV
jgi:hypothetical protein